MNVYEVITEKIMADLKKGEIPWRKSWASLGAPRSWNTSREYTGVNLWLLNPGAEYATIKQISEAGGKVKKGSKAKIVVFMKRYEKKTKDVNGQETTENRFTLRYYHVFEVGVDTEGINPKRQTAIHNPDTNPIEAAEKLIAEYIGKPEIIHGGDKAAYNPTFDIVKMPKIESFCNTEEYYSTLFHEYIHSTGHQSRLNRSGITQIAAFGSQTYSQEELIAEFGSAYLCEMAGISQPVIKNQTAYIQGWLKSFKDNAMIAVRAASAAQKATNFIIGKKDSEENEETE